MIRRYFGPYAKIRERFFGGFWVTTPSGGDVEIGYGKCKVHAGGADVHEALVLLAAEAWGGMTVQGSAEYVMAMMAHGEATGVNVLPTLKPEGGCMSLFVTVLVFLIVLGIADGTELVAGPGECFIAAFAASIVWRLMRNAAKREARRRAQFLRFPFPYIHGRARYSDDEDLRRGGLI
jgi:hypothetical protein